MASIRPDQLLRDARDDDEEQSGPETDPPSSSESSRRAILQLQNLNIRFGRQHVLRDIDIDILRGQTVCVIGESGCGKTVMMKTLIGLVQPTTGRVLFDGRDFRSFDDRELTQQRIRFGFVFQMAALFDSLTIGQNVAFPLREHTQKTPEEVEEIVRQRLLEVGLPSSVVEKRPAELSGGMRKRVGLARALALEPEVVLYDEPTTGLDPIMSDVINELILRTRQKHPVTSIIVTHDMKTTRKVADRVIMFYPTSRLRADEPQILYDGHPGAVDDCPDPRVRQFVDGDAGDRISEMAAAEAALR